MELIMPVKFDKIPKIDEADVPEFFTLPKELKEAWDIRMEAAGKTGFNVRANLRNSAEKLEKAYRESNPNTVDIFKKLVQIHKKDDRLFIIWHWLKLNMQSDTYANDYSACMTMTQKYYDNHLKGAKRDERKAVQAEDAPIVVKPAEKKSFCKKCTIL